MSWKELKSRVIECKHSHCVDKVGNWEKAGWSIKKDKIESNEGFFNFGKASFPWVIEISKIDPGFIVSWPN